MESEMDKFPEKRKQVQKLDNSFDTAAIDPIIRAVMQFLMTKALHEGRRQDQYNPTTLGNVTYHMTYNEATQETRIAFDKHPDTWRVQDIYFEMRNMEADMMMEDQANDSILDNPFRY
jgi:hypothetical protein